MPILALVAAPMFLSVATAVEPVQTTREPWQILYDLRETRSWKAERASLDGHAGRKHSPYGWQLKITYGITPDGRMMNCNVISPSGSDTFDRAACAALLKEARFQPERNDRGEAVRSSGEVDFRLRMYPAMICATGLDEPEQ